MNKSHITTTAAILFAVATAGVGLANAQGFGGINSDNTREAPPMHEQRGAFKPGRDATDYTSFVTAVGEDAPILDTITADNFDRFVEMRTLLQNGDKEGAKAIAQELGLPTPPPLHDSAAKDTHKGMRGLHLTDEQRAAVEAALDAHDYNAFIAAHGADSNIATFVTEERFADMAANYAERQAQKALIDAAIDARDYDAFVQAVGEDNARFAQINETNFAQFAELHDLRQAGDTEAAKALADELGLHNPEHRPHPMDQMREHTGRNNNSTNRGA